MAGLAASASSRHQGDPQDFELPPVGAAWNTIVNDLDPQSRYRAFEASTMMALRKNLRRGSAWVNHSIGFAPASRCCWQVPTGAARRKLHHQILGLPDRAMAFLGPIPAGVGGLTALAEAAGRGQIEIGADKLPAFAANPTDGRGKPRKTGRLSSSTHRFRPVARPAAGSRRRHPLQRGAAGLPSVVETTSCWPSTARSWPAGTGRRQGRIIVRLCYPRYRSTAHISTAMRAVELSGKGRAGARMGRKGLERR